FGCCDEIRHHQNALFLVETKSSCCRSLEAAVFDISSAEIVFHRKFMEVDLWIQWSSWWQVLFPKLFSCCNSWRSKFNNEPESSEKGFIQYGNEVCCKNCNARKLLHVIQQN